jgi:hypothetical protein
MGMTVLLVSILTDLVAEDLSATEDHGSQDVRDVRRSRRRGV